MNIEEGKFYRARDGRKVGPMEGADSSGVSFRMFKAHGLGARWAVDGINVMTRGSPVDLIAEWLDGPVRTVTTTRKEIVPGEYGKVRILAPHDMFPNCAHVRIDDGLSTAAELRAAAATLTEIADALESP